ncbi:MAG: FHA domain-containing protein [Anaerolineae bacterium]|nr:FHA domain-containing protein [Anaerolineae bacterium]
MIQNNDSFRLIVRRGPQPNQVFELTKDAITLGRDITNDITINDPEVSRHHLRITRGADGYTIEDLGSTNGTFINGQRLTGSRAMNRGDMIGLGETVTLTYDVMRPQQPGVPPQYSQPQQPPQNQYSQSQQPPQNQYAPPPQQPPQYSQGQQPPQNQYAPPPQQPPYGGQPAGQPNYYQQGQVPPAPGYDAGYDQPAGDYNQNPPGYDYDPYAVREEESPSTWRWVVIGCAGLLLFCCCASVIGVVIIDTARLWCELPIFKDTVTPIAGLIAEALGIVSEAITCP